MKLPLSLFARTNSPSGKQALPTDLDTDYLDTHLRQYSMEKQLHSLLWKIDSGDISYEARRNSQISIESGVGNHCSLLFYYTPGWKK